MIRKTLMVSLACCLVLSLHIAAFADCPGTPPPPPSQTEIDAFVAFQTSVFNTLFGSSWTQEDMAYPLSTRVDGLGVYQGTNQLGQPFTLSVVWDQPLDLATVCMTPQQRQQAIAEQVTVRSVAGSIITPLAQVDVVATAISGFDNGQLVSYFMIVAPADPNGPFFPPATNGGQAIIGGITPDPTNGGPTIQPCPDSNPDCGSGGGTGPLTDRCANCTQCNIDHNARLAAAKATRDATKAAARQTRDNAIAAADATFNTTVSAAKTAAAAATGIATAFLAAALAGCALTSFLSFFNPLVPIGCALIAFAAYNVRLLSIQVTFNSAMLTAAATRTAAKAAARLAEQQACAQAKQLFDQSKAIADVAFIACRAVNNCQQLGCP